MYAFKGHVIINDVFTEPDIVAMTSLELTPVKEYVFIS